MSQPPGTKGSSLQRVVACAVCSPPREPVEMDALAGWSEESLLAASAVVLTASLCGIYFIHKARSSSSAAAPSTSAGAPRQLTSTLRGGAKLHCVACGA